MVQLEEVEDETFQNQAENDGDWDTDSDSDVSVDEAFDESLYDRVTALKDVIPPAQRRQLASTVSSASEWGWWGLSSVAQVSWLVGVSVMLLGIPFAVGYSEEQMVLMEEQQQQMNQSSNDMLGSTDQSGAKQEAL